MSTILNTPAKVVLSAGLFSLVLMTSTAQQGMSKTTELQHPLITTSTPASTRLEHLSKASDESYAESEKLERDALHETHSLTKIEGQKIAFYWW
ncbi:hypothetical protein [Acaryochloris marina]|uniref:Uncharacterized protein n=1 Tax=Acaryochloris marina (strain MBIC 11017) TaxID=329726 RepID=B0BYK3_ACAM1|nr:hypothetical protein [Acaryochloris marina]ABW25888.1 hypothetical protein AM1_0844 [Acaryochloris marina MBIC11017]BDM80747.1 hypothetical protein AM10699_36150 [Acaryochloris marina MBIC10699]